MNNWYKKAQYQDLKSILFTYIQQADRGIIEPAMAIEDIESKMGQSIDPIGLMSTLTEVSTMVVQSQGGSLTPNQDLFINNLRSYIDEIQVGSVDSIAEPEPIDTI